MGRMTSHILYEKKHVWTHQPATVPWPHRRSLKKALKPQRAPRREASQAVDFALYVDLVGLCVSAMNGIRRFVGQQNAGSRDKPWIKKQDSPQLENLDMIYDEIWWDMMRYDEIWWDMMRYDEIWWDMMRYKTNQKIPDIFSKISKHLQTSPTGNSQRGMSAGHRAA